MRGTCDSSHGLGYTSQSRKVLQGVKRQDARTGSLLDTILHFCYNNTLMRIKSDLFHMAPAGNQYRFRGISVKRFFFAL